MLFEKQMGEVKLWMLRFSEEYLGSENRKEKEWRNRRGISQSEVALFLMTGGTGVFGV